MPNSLRRFAIHYSFLFSIALLACSSLAPVYSGDAATVSQERLLTDIKYLASDELEGRGVGLPGLDAAADYIRDQFAKAGLKLDSVGGGPYQTFTMSTGATLGSLNSLEITGPDAKKLTLTQTTDFVPQSFGAAGAFSGELVFCGYGIEAADKKFDEFAGVDLKGKVAIIMRKVPRQGNPHAPFSDAHGGVSSYGELRTKLDRAFDKGAVAVLFVNDPYSGRNELEQDKKRVAKLADAVAEAAVEFEAVDAQDAEKLAAARKKLSEEVGKYKAGKGHLGTTEPDTLMKFGYGGRDAIRNLPVLHITRAVCDSVLKPALNKTLAEIETEIDKDLKPQSAVLTGWNAGGVVTIERKQALVKNVVAVLEGTGPTADETIVVGAHYDHVGRGAMGGSFVPGTNEIHNGADDNASGTVSLLEVARRLAARPEKPKRRIVFVAFTGEEMGLFGSARYTKEPIFPLDKTIAMVNMDMVGRLTDDKLTIFGAGTSPIWNDMLTRLGKAAHFDLSLKPEGMGPSDHQSFFMKQIPVLHFFTGTHGDYHRPSDDWEKINIPGTERVVELVEKLVIELASMPERPQYIAVKGTAQISDRPAGSRPYFGSVPDFGAEKPGYALSGVVPGSPAEKGGLKAGDRIVQLGQHKIDNLEDFDANLRKFSPGETVEVAVMRGQERVVLKVVLDKPRGG
jgi:hypothetical protein